MNTPAAMVGLESVCQIRRTDSVVAELKRVPGISYSIESSQTILVFFESKTEDRKHTGPNAIVIVLRSIQTSFA